VERVFPWVPVRQWVLSLPFKLRYRMAYDSKLLADILNIFVRAVFGELRRRARESLGFKQSKCGAVTFVQRFGSAVNLHVHFHAIVLDGVYAAGPDGRPEFHELPPPEDAEVLQVTTLIAGRAGHDPTPRTGGRARRVAGERSRPGGPLRRGGARPDRHRAQRRKPRCRPEETTSMATAWKRWRVHVALRFRDLTCMPM
jgi:hypothetical protein